MKLNLNIIDIKKINENDTEKEMNLYLNFLHDNLLDIIHSFDLNVVTYDVSVVSYSYDRNRLTMKFTTDIEDIKNNDFDILINMRLRQALKAKFKRPSIFIQHSIKK